MWCLSKLLMSVYTVWLWCIIFVLLFIDDILYKWCFDFWSSIMNIKDDFSALMMLMIIMLKTVFSCLMIIIHWVEKYVMKERYTWWENKVWAIILNSMRLQHFDISQWLSAFMTQVLVEEVLSK